MTQAGGYATSGAMKGYLFTVSLGTGTTISPADFSAIMAGDSPCVTGEVAPTSDNSGMALLGWNVNQLAAAASPNLDFTPTSDGLAYRITNTGGTPLRLRLRDSTGVATGRWCADVTGSTGFIAWSAFNTACWDPSVGTYYAKTPIVSIDVTVAGNMSTAVSYDFCLNDLAEVNQ